MKNIIHKNVTLEVNSNFELDMCFCSCSTQIDKHDVSCPNYGKKFDEQPETILTFTLEDGTIYRIALDKYRFL